MTRLPSFAALVASARHEMLAIVRQAGEAEMAGPVTAFATLIALSRCQWTFSCRDNDYAPAMCCSPAPRGSAPVKSIRERTLAATAAIFLQPNGQFSLGLDEWVQEQGFLLLVQQLVVAGADVEAIQRFAGLIARHARYLGDTLRASAEGHCRAVVDRDLGSDAKPVGLILYRPVQWALAPGLAGRVGRRVVLQRRRQALEAYGALSSVLMDPGITRFIDHGLPLKDRLKRRLGIDEAQLRRLTGIRPLKETLAGNADHVGALRRLLLHEVPVHEWPSGSAWSNGCWRPSGPDSLIRADYLTGEAQVADAINALRMDLLSPLARERASTLGLAGNYRLDSFITHLNQFDRIAQGPLHRMWLRTVRAAVIGPRGIKSFGEAAALWHRRAATLAAVRHETQADQPGWPALSPPWHSADGKYAIVVLTDAADLVAEGNALDHCVGGYYHECRAGTTQILSMREGETRVATLELLVGDGSGTSLSIVAGQFKAHRNERPAPHLWEVLRQFLEDLKQGRHAVNPGPLLAHRKRMMREGDYAANSSALSLDHARRSFAFYRPLLPKGTAQDFDGWCEASGLIRALDTILPEIAALKMP